MEFRLAEGEEAPEVGGELTVSLFEAGQMIDVTGTSKGKGFQGAVKRWNFRTQDNSHGNLVASRAGFYRHVSDTWPRIQRQENGRSNG